MSEFISKEYDPETEPAEFAARARSDAEIALGDAIYSVRKALANIEALGPEGLHVTGPGDYELALSVLPSTIVTIRGAQHMLRLHF